MSMEERARGSRQLIALLTGPARRIGEKVASIRRRARGRAGARELARLDDRLLRDIGLTRSEARAAAYGLLNRHEPSPAGPSSSANVVRLKPRAIAVRVDQATSAPPLKRAACE